MQRKVTLDRPEGVGLGFNIIGGEGDTGIFISYISPGSVADQSRELKPGDQIIEVRRISLPLGPLHKGTTFYRHEGGAALIHVGSWAPDSVRSLKDDPPFIQCH